MYIFFLTTIIFFLFLHQSLSVDDIQTKWSKFKATYNRSYSSTETEDIRFKIFQTNVAEIDMHNEKFKNGVMSFELGINEYSDRTAEEVEKMFSNNEPMEFGEIKTYKSTLPSFKPHSHRDWREDGVIGPVRSQKSCRSCYALSTVGSLESQYSIVTGIYSTFSDQYVIDCSSNPKFRNRGCKGGSRKRVFEFVIKKGIIFEDEYRPYSAKKRPCRHNGGSNYVREYILLPPGNEQELMRFVDYFGPVTVSFHGSSLFIRYHSGVLDDRECRKNESSHSALIVGYGTERGSDYWLVKNSWGEKFGDNGFIKMSRNKDNQCGIANYAIIGLF